MSWKNFPFERITGVKENLILSFQQAILADGIKLPKYGADGLYEEEAAQAMKKCIIKRRLLSKYKNATKLAQRLLDIAQDGICGPDTEKAIKEYQSKHNLEVDGCIGFNTWRSLLAN